MNTFRSSFQKYDEITKITNVRLQPISAGLKARELLYTQNTVADKVWHKALQKLYLHEACP
jgi:hypothetical protein